MVKHESVFRRRFCILAVSLGVTVTVASGCGSKIGMEGLPINVREESKPADLDSQSTSPVGSPAADAAHATTTEDGGRSMGDGVRVESQPANNVPDVIPPPLPPIAETAFAPKKRDDGRLLESDKFAVPQAVADAALGKGEVTFQFYDENSKVKVAGVSPAVCRAIANTLRNHPVKFDKKWLEKAEHYGVFRFDGGRIEVHHGLLVVFSGETYVGAAGSGAVLKMCGSLAGRMDEKRVAEIFNEFSGT